MNFKIIATAAALLATQSFAIIGVGAHYAPGFGTKMKAGPKAKVADNIDFSHEGFDEMMQGFGFKVWVDILPIIDVEATFNIQFGSYDATLFVVKDPMAIISGDIPSDAYKQIDLEIELGGTPFGKANPKFVQMTGDLSITYPITFIPIIRPYIGGGLTYYMNTFILNQPFTKKVVGDTYKAMVDEVLSDPLALVTNPSASTDISNRVSDAMVESLQDAALEEGLKTSIGGHVLVGVRAKLPIIPIAAYANFKYYFGGDFPEEIDPGHMTAEVGVGFAL